MKTKILVLAAFTNGHEAAVALVRRQGWSEDEYEIVFCGTHTQLLECLTEEPAFAVVPVWNSIIKNKVAEVTDKLSALREDGYDFKTVDQIEHQVNHCLMAHESVADPSEITRVFSHPKAFEQCGMFLDCFGITPDRRSKRDSTGFAAKEVSRSNPALKFAAIAPRSAAENYGLKNVLAENIQDELVNLTTFLLLENKVEVIAKTVGIIGINGGEGQLHKELFESLGCTVIGADKNKPTGLTNQQVVEQSDVVLFAIPIRKTPREIRLLVPYIKEDQLVMDVTSVKQPAIEAMLESKAQVVGLHPMFRPDMPFEGQTVVACPARLTDPKWKTWVRNILTRTKAKIKWSTAVEHDQYMTTVQVNPHIANLVSALLITGANVSVRESMSFTSPFYLIVFSLMGRLVSQNPKLYAAIVMENPETLPMLRHRREIEKRLIRMIEEKDYIAFEQLFVTAGEHFGPEVTNEANDLFRHLISVLNTKYGKNSLTLEFTRAHNKPGLLTRISEVFSRHDINLLGINNSASADGKHQQFNIDLEQARSSDAVRKALEEIELWDEPRVKVVK